MPLTRDFRVTIRDRLERDPGFRKALLEEGVQCLLAGKVDVGKSVLRDFGTNIPGGGQPARRSGTPRRRIRIRFRGPRIASMTQPDMELNPHGVRLGTFRYLKPSVESSLYRNGKVC